MSIDRGQHPAPALSALLRLLLLSLLGVWLAWGCAAPCTEGQRQVCRTRDDCRCGSRCQSQDDCSGRDVCARVLGEPTEPGACVDVLWLYDPPPPCVPLCRASQYCVDFGTGRNICSDECTQHSDCRSGCCVPLTSGPNVCAPDASICRNVCIPTCRDDQVCLALTRPTCADRCSSDGDCPDSCCLPLQGGGGACAPGGLYCPTMPPPLCRLMEACTLAQSRLTPVPEALCGSYGSYEGTLRNNCSEAIYCRACWWSNETNSYSDCVPLGRIPTNATVPVGSVHCADAPLPEPPFRTRCVDEPSFTSNNDCLGQTPLP